MKKGFYPKLAFSGIRKNKKLYIPYLLTCIGMIVMFYIITFLSQCNDIVNRYTMREILRLGSDVIAIFSVIFLFYTNSFLIRRRKKEFGLYNILGMSKWNLARILINEAVIIMVISLFAGLFLGVLFSGIAKYAMLHMLKENISFLSAFDINFFVVLKSVVLFACIFTLILLNTLRQIHFSKPVELLKGGNIGEKPPKANWIIAILGLVILGVAYYIALTVKNPIIAMIKFFIAVIMVIIATYLLFIAGSVALCKILQNSKKYYYKTNHFVSISSMIYRMKRNGASLASICILCTMVLVMLSTVICLYASIEDTLRTNYTRDISVGYFIDYIDNTKNNATLYNKTIEETKEIINNVLSEKGLEVKNAFDLKCVNTTSYINENNDIIIGADYNLNTMNNTCIVIFAPIEDYNKIMGTNEILADDEVIIHTVNQSYNSDKIVINGVKSDTDSIMKYKVKKQVSDFIIKNSNGEATMYVFVPNFDKEFFPKIASYGWIEEYDGGGYRVSSIPLDWSYKFDLNCKESEKSKITEDILIAITNSGIHTNLEKNLNGGHLLGDEYYEDEDSYMYYVRVGLYKRVIAEGRNDYMELYGGLLIIGVILSIVFIFATILLMYYKQISEGYEDQSRFDIMQKVGMTKKEIRKSINSQVLTVFFAPITLAGVHLLFAFSMLKKMLAIFNMTNITLFTTVTIISFIVFALFYMIVYVITSKAYYSIVKNSD